MAEAGNTSLDTIRARLEATYQNAAASASASTSASTSAAATAGLAANAGAAGAGSAAGASSADLEAALAEAASIRGLLQRNSEELEGLLKAMNGEYVLPEAGGDLLRDGASVLPTGAPRLCMRTTLVAVAGWCASVLPTGVHWYHDVKTAWYLMAPDTGHGC